MRAKVRYASLIPLLLFFVLTMVGCGPKKGAESPQMVAIIGQVTDDQGTPIANVSVDLGDKGSKTDKHGRFRIEILPGSYTLRAMAEGYQKYVSQIEVMDKGQRINIKLTKVDLVFPLDDLAGYIATGVANIIGKPLSEITPDDLDEVTADQIIAQPADEFGSMSVGAAILTEMDALGDKLGIILPRNSSQRQEFLQQFMASVLQKLKQGRSCDGTLVEEVLHEMGATN